MRGRQHPAKWGGSTCAHAYLHTRKRCQPTKSQKKSGKNRDGHLKQKKERTYALFQCVHAYMCTRSKKSQPNYCKADPSSRRKLFSLFFVFVLFWCMQVMYQQAMIWIFYALFGDVSFRRSFIRDCEKSTSCSIKDSSDGGGQGLPHSK